MGRDRKTPTSPENSPVMVFVDVDNTLIRGASVYLFGLEAWKSGFIRWHHVIPALWRQVSFVRIGETPHGVIRSRDRAQALVAGHSFEDFLEVGESAWRRRIAPRVFPDIRAVLNKHMASGHEVWLVTASPAALAGIIARDLGFTGALGTELEIEDGVFTGDIKGEMLHGPAKAKAALAHAHGMSADLSRAWAYSDSFADVPLLEAVGNPVAVNPDPSLLAYATTKGWHIVWPEGTTRHQGRRLRRAEKSADHT